MVGMNDVIVIDHHSEHLYLCAEINYSVVNMAWNDLSREDLKSRCAVIQVSHGAAGNGAQTAKPLVNIGLDFPPEGTSTWIGFEVLDDSDSRVRWAGDIFIVAQATIS